MNQQQAVVAIQQRWLSMWPGTGATLTVFDNDVVDDADTYARVKVEFLEDSQQTMGAVGNRRFNRPGIITVELRAPGNLGRNDVDVLCGHVRSIFEAVRFGAVGTEEGVITFAAHVDSQLTRSTPRHWVSEVVVAFEYVEVR